MVTHVEACGFKSLERIIFGAFWVPVYICAAVFSIIRVSGQKDSLCTEVMEVNPVLR